MRSFAIFLLLLLPALAEVVPAQEPVVVYSHVAWSPDGKMIAYTRSEITQGTPRRMTSDIYISKPDGSEARKLTGGNGNESFPAWSRDGKTVFFSSGAAGSREQDIMSVRTDGTQLKPVIHAPGRDSAPQISPDGKRLLFNSERDGGMPQIYISKIDGSDPKRLTDDIKAAFYNPVWSPNGRCIVYYREIRDGKDQIWTMDPDGSDKKLLTNNHGHNFYPSWSADGSLVIFTRMEGEKQELYSIGRDGTGLKPMGITSFFARPSPDGKRIAYVRGQEGRMTIFVANIDGTNAVEVLK
ncbi:MAG: TolB family protein [Pyrinomonadaceae bacterium]